MNGPRLHQAVSRAVHALVTSNGRVRVATAYVSPSLTVRVTHRRIKGHVPKNGHHLDCNLTIGRPNYAARQFIRAAKRAGEPFPIKRVQLTLA